MVQKCKLIKKATFTKHFASMKLNTTHVHWLVRRKNYTDLLAIQLEISFTSDWHQFTRSIQTSIRFFFHQCNGALFRSKHFQSPRKIQPFDAYYLNRFQILAFFKNHEFKWVSVLRCSSVSIFIETFFDGEKSPKVFVSWNWKIFFERSKKNVKMKNWQNALFIQTFVFIKLPVTFTH